MPTPVIGMVGLVDDVKRVLQPGFKNPGDFIALLGMTREDLSVSQYAAVIDGNPTVRESARILTSSRCTFSRSRVSAQDCPLQLLQTQVILERASVFQ